MSPWNSAIRLCLAAITIAALDVGCVSGPKFVEPAGANPTSFTAAPLTHLAGDSPVVSEPEATAWWQPLHSEQLDATIRLALERNRDLAAARATLGQMQELAAASEGARYPQPGF